MPGLREAGERSLRGSILLSAWRGRVLVTIPPVFLPLGALTNVGGVTGGLAAAGATALTGFGIVGGTGVFPASALGVNDALPRTGSQSRPRTLRGPWGRGKPERDATCTLFSVFDASAGEPIRDVEPHVFVEIASEPLFLGLVEVGTLGGGSLIFRRGGGSIMRFDPGGPETSGLSVEAAGPGSDLVPPFDCGVVVPAADDEPGKMGGNPRFDGRTGRCFVCWEAVLSGVGVTTGGLKCEITGASVR